jgi:hypothetical protein
MTPRTRRGWPLVRCTGETSATSITCNNTGTTADTTPATGWDDSVTHEGISIDPSPRTITCEIVIDP